MTLRGGRRCALPPAPPSRFFRLAPVGLWTCYLAGFHFASGKLSGDPASVNAGFYLASGKLSGDPASVNASRGEAPRPPPCTPDPLL